jgi:serine/threonine protein kinase
VKKYILYHCKSDIYLLFQLLLKYCAECALGVLALHMASIAHRDIKPENFLISDDGHVLLTDYGTAGVIEGEVEDGVVGTAFVFFFFPFRICII